jgi:hypothetical protein
VAEVVGKFFIMRERMTGRAPASHLRDLLDGALTAPVWR